ncbi:MAG: ArsC family reductase [Cytophagaceae bacterium]|nr:ArsC family reductase [Cytophagaceae bacterium]
MIIYGIKNCDTVKKATDWLKKKNIAFEFHDYKTQGISEEKLKEWTKQVSWEILLNKRGTTWKKLSAAVQGKTNNEKAAVAVMRENTSIIKRPVIEKNGKIIAVGFDEKEYSNKI